LEVLAREIVLNAGNIETKSLAMWRDFSRAINFVRDIGNEISRRRANERNILRELHRIVHRQFPWQRPASAGGIMRYLKIFGGSELEPMLAAKTGLPIRKFFLLSFAVSGHLNTATNYSAIGVKGRHEDRS
jgi:hypothetical protein